MGLQFQQSISTVIVMVPRVGAHNPSIAEVDRCVMGGIDRFGWHDETLLEVVTGCGWAGRRRWSQMGEGGHVSLLGASGRALTRSFVDINGYFFI